MNVCTKIIGAYIISACSFKHELQSNLQKMYAYNSPVKYIRADMVLFCFMGFFNLCEEWKSDFLFSL